MLEKLPGNESCRIETAFICGMFTISVTVIKKLLRHWPRVLDLITFRHSVWTPVALNAVFLSLSL
jgi:hypothetical protein